MKHWTKRDALTGGTVSADVINEEMRAHQSSMPQIPHAAAPNCYNA